MAEIIRVVEELGPWFDQVVLAGYPPFVKNVIDAGLAAGVDWPAYRIKLILAGEVFSEEWRDLMGAPGRDDRAAGRFGVAVRDRRCRGAGHRDAAERVGPPVPGGPAGCAARADRRVAAADAGPVRPDDEVLPDRRVDAAVQLRRDDAARAVPHRRRGRAGRVRPDAGVLLAARARPAGGGWRRRAAGSAARRSCRSPTSSGGRCSPCPTSAPTSIRRTSPSRWKVRRSATGSPASSSWRPQKPQDRDRELRVTVELAPGESGIGRAGRGAGGRDPGRASPAQQRVRPLRTGRVPAASHRTAPGRRPGVLPARHQAPLHPPDRLASTAASSRRSSSEAARRAGRLLRS